MPNVNKTLQRKKRHNRIRSKMHGTNDCPRLIVYRSLKFNYAQLINDDKNICILGVSDLKIKDKKSRTAKAKMIGQELAKKALEKKIAACVFDRNGYKFHGRVKGIAEGAREGGLKF